MYVFIDPGVRLEPLRMVIVEALACGKPSGTGSSARREAVDRRAMDRALRYYGPVRRKRLSFRRCSGPW
jgi:hypothetical protein